MFGGTHGNETTGVSVVKNVLEALGLPSNPPAGTHVVDGVRGALYFGIGNPSAVARGTRGAGGPRDLNRCFHESFFSDPQAMASPDERRAAELADLLASADYFFDLHSVSAPNARPFVGITTRTSRHDAICASLPVSIVLDVNRVLGRDVGIDDPAIDQTPTTCSWVNRHGGVGLCYEMGSQDDLDSVPRATRDLLRLLEACGSVDHAFSERIGVPDLSLPTADAPANYRLTHCERNRFKGFQFAEERFTKSWTPVKKGDAIGRYEDGEIVRAPDDGLLAFPAGVHTLSRNPSLFYLAKQEEKTPRDRRGARTSA